VLVDSMEPVPIIPEDAYPADLLPEDLSGTVPFNPDFETEFVLPDNIEPINSINDQKSQAYMAAASPEKPAAAPEPKGETAADPGMATQTQVVAETTIDVTGLAGSFIAVPAPVVIMETQMDPQPALQVPQGPTLVVSLVSCGSKERDNRRLKQIHGVLTSVPGADRFAFLCKENGRSFRLDFPNERTAISDSLLRELRGMLGDVNVAVEE